MELIDRVAVYNDMMYEMCGTGFQSNALSVINQQPTIEVETIKHGRWKNGCKICPICGMDKFYGLDADIWADWQPKYCPNCGAKMDMEEKDNET